MTTVGSVVSLPMRDGNRIPAAAEPITSNVVSLPMRDGNPQNSDFSSRNLTVFAYL